MGENTKIPKTRAARLLECEEHLYLLADAANAYRKQRVKYKQVAAELRVLVGDHKPKLRLLIAMMEEYGFSYDVQPPPQRPIPNQPIPMVGWQNDPELKALGENPDIEKLQALLASRRRPVPFSEFVDRGLAVYIKPRDYSFAELVSAIAQQTGSGHEAVAVDRPLVRLTRIKLGSEDSHIDIMMNFANLVLHVGKLFLDHVTNNCGYEPKYFRRATSDSKPDA